MRGFHTVRALRCISSSSGLLPLLLLLSLSSSNRTFTVEVWILSKTKGHWDAEVRVTVVLMTGLSHTQAQSCTQARPTAHGGQCPLEPVPRPYLHPLPSPNYKKRKLSLKIRFGVRRDSAIDARTLSSQTTQVAQHVSVVPCVARTGGRHCDGSGTDVCINRIY